jgi:hypothetical protein
MKIDPFWNIFLSISITDPGLRSPTERIDQQDQGAVERIGRGVKKDPCFSAPLPLEKERGSLSYKELGHSFDFSPGIPAQIKDDPANVAHGFQDLDICAAS